MGKLPPSQTFHVEIPAKRPRMILFNGKTIDRKGSVAWLIAILIYQRVNMEVQDSLSNNWWEYTGNIMGTLQSYCALTLPYSWFWLDMNNDPTFQTHGVCGFTMKQRWWMIDLTSNKITIEVNNLEYDGTIWEYGA